MSPPNQKMRRRADIATASQFQDVVYRASLRRRSNFERLAVMQYINV
jgi:hypothetical protein